MGPKTEKKAITFLLCVLCYEYHGFSLILLLHILLAFRFVKLCRIGNFKKISKGV